jgi:hypothetical protein
MNNRNLLSNVHLTLLGLLPLTRRWRRCMRNDVVKRRDTDRRFRFLVQGQEARCTLGNHVNYLKGTLSRA